MGTQVKDRSSSTRAGERTRQPGVDGDPGRRSDRWQVVKAQTVLILGAGTMQLPAIRAARARGLSVAVASPNANEPGVAEADRHVICDLADEPGMLRAARRLAAQEELAAVFTAGTDFSATVAYLAEHLGLPGVPRQAALAATHKGTMRARFTAAGVPSPRFAVASGSVEQPPAGLSLPLVVKPVDNMGARGVRRVDDVAELTAAVDAARACSRRGRAIIEELMSGPELSIDALVQGGKLTVCGVADRIIRFPPYFVEMGHTLPSAMEDADLRQVLAVFERGVAALGIDCGAAKGDLKLTANGPMIGEIAARLSGGYMSGWTFPLASGLDLTSAALRIALGEDAGDLRQRRRWTAAERAFISIPGRIAAVDGEADARAIDGVREVFVLAQPGEDVWLPTSNVEKCGNVIACADNRDRAIDAAERAARALFVRLQTGVPATDQYLQAATPLFALPQPVRARFEQMPLHFGGLRRLAGRSDDSPIAVAQLPGAGDAVGIDYHGGQLAEALATALRYGRARLVEAPDGGAAANDQPLVLGAVFWHALLTAGAQGAVYVLDAVRAGSADGLIKDLQRIHPERRAA